MELNESDFTQLVEWLGPKALRTHKRYPRGHRYFNTDTRIFQFNIDPSDYFMIEPGIEGVSPPKVKGTVPEAYRAMRDVIKTLRARKIRFRIIRVSWESGGSYIEATFPHPKKK